MAINRGCVGLTTDEHTFKYEPREVILYALGVGAKRAELDYLYEGRGPKVLPTFAVVPAYDALHDALGRTGGTMENIVHGHQRVTVHRPIPPRGTLRTTCTVAALYDLKRMAQAVLTTRTTDADGELLVETEWGILFLGEGGFGGEGPPGRETSTPTRPPDGRVEETTSPEQALLYRLLGDKNPLHADPEFPLVARFQGRPILHGLCSYGYLCRAVANGLCKGDAGRIKSITARFSKPVWPGDTLLTDLWVEGDRAWMRTATRESGEPVLTHCTAELW
jgi:acyl dehydratase